MKRLITVWCILALCAAAQSAKPEEAKPAAASAAKAESPLWKQMQTLVGEWRTTYEGQSIPVTYTMTGGKTALMESQGFEKDPMITMFHPDGSTLVATHYCGSGNQPRMRARSMTQGSIAFDFVDATNLKGKGDDVMRSLLIRFLDKDHVEQEWTSEIDGKPSTMVFKLERKRP